MLAVRGNYGAHRVFQTSAATLNAILVLWLMVLPFRDFVAPASNPGGLPLSAIATTRIHAAVGFAALVFGLFVTLRANKLMPKFLRFNNYKAFMRIAYALYMLATLIGLFVYITWFCLVSLFTYFFLLFHGGLFDVDLFCLLVVVA